MNPDEYYTYEDRAYISPTVSRDEQLAFVDQLRDTIGNNTSQINTQTQRLGTDISPNYGGLTGSNSYFAQRYQTTPVQAYVSGLKATAQAKALNDLLSNYQNQATNKYNQAYRAAQKRAAAAAAAGSNGYSGDGGYEQGEGEFATANTAYGIDTSKYSGKTINGQPVNITAIPMDNGYVEERDQFGNVWDVYKWSPASNKYVRVSSNDSQYQLMNDNFYHSTTSSAYRDYKSANDFANAAADIAQIMLAPGFYIGKELGNLFTGKRTVTYE